MEEIWTGIYNILRGGIKDKLQGLEKAQATIGAGGMPDRDQLHDLVDTLLECLPDNNFKVSQGALSVLQALIEKDSNHLRPFINMLIPPVVERLGDARQQVRQDACSLLLVLLSTYPANQIMERMQRFWSHQAWKVRHGILQTLAEAIAQRTPGLVDSPDVSNHVITSSVNLLEDKKEEVRDAAHDCLEEVYRALGPQLLTNLQQQSIRPAVFKELIARLDSVSPTNIDVQQYLQQDVASTPAALPRSQTISQAEASTRGPPKKSMSQPASMSALQASAIMAQPTVIAPIQLPSERDLHSELQLMITPLTGTVEDWQQRIAHMQRLQGIAQGCPVSWHDTLVDALKQLKEPLTTQVEDRRSAVSKQACALLSGLAALLGPKFQDYLIYFFPVVAKVLPITIQVMADAANACCIAMLSSCHCPRALPVVVNHASKDKNAKIRAFCVGYLAHIIQQWEPSMLQRSTDELESAMTCAGQDANAEARAAARKLYAAYCEVLPDAARNFAARSSSTLMDKLSASKTAARGPPARTFSRPPSMTGSRASNSDMDIIVMAPTRPATATSIPSNASLAAAAAMPPPRAGPPGRVVTSASEIPALPFDKRPATGRKSMAGPSRVLGASSQDGTGIEPVANLPMREPVQYTQDTNRTQASRISLGARPNTSGAAPAQAQRVPGPVANQSNAFNSALYNDGQGQQGELVVNGRTSQGPSSAGGSASHAGVTRSSFSEADIRMTLPKVVHALMSGTRPLNDKVDLLTSVSDILRQHMETGYDSAGAASANNTIFRELDKLMPKLLDYVEDSSPKVAGSATGALADIITTCPAVMETYMERTLPLLFARLHDTKDTVRASAAKALECASSCFPADLCVPGLVRSLDSIKVPRVKQTVLEWGAQNLGHDTPSGVPSGGLFRQWLRAVGGLIGDKHSDLRKCAFDTIRAAYEHVDQAAVTAFIRHSTGVDALPLKKLLIELESSQSSAQDAEAVLHVSPSKARTAAPAPGHATHAHPPESSYATNGHDTHMEDVEYESHKQATSHGTNCYAPQAQQQQQYAAGDYMSPQRQDQNSSSNHHEPANYQYGPVSDPGGRTSQPQQAIAAIGPDSAYPAPGRASPSISASGQLVTAPAVGSTGPAMAVTPATNSTAATAGYTNGLYSNYHRTSTVATARPASVAPTTGPTLHVPPDIPGQVRLLNFLIMKLTSGGDAVDQLQQMRSKCSQILPGSWSQTAASLINALSRKVLPSQDMPLREAGIELIRTLCSCHPGVLQQQESTVTDLLPAAITASGNAPPQTMKLALEGVDTLLSVVNLSDALSVASKQLAAGVDANASYALMGLCGAVQRVAARMPGDQLVACVHTQLRDNLRACAEHSLLENRKAAIYALAQIKIKIGDARWETWSTHFNKCTQELVSWAQRKVMEPAPAAW